MKGYNSLVMRCAGLALAACLCAPGLAWAQGQMAVQFYHLDAQGNVLALTDQNGNLVESHDYDAFGQEVNPQPGTQPKRFTGKERDPETGWDYFGARYYGSRIGRFTTVDPYVDQLAALVNPQRWNRYAYVSNNPLKYVDPDGREQVVIVGGKTYMGGVDGMSAGDEQVRNVVFGAMTAAVGLLTPGPEDLVIAGVIAKAGGVLGRFGKAADEVVDVAISHRKSPHAAKHIDDAQAGGKPDILTVDRTRTGANRKESLKGTNPQKGMDRDEYPPACCGEGGTGASVRPIPRGDNRSAGAQLGNQVKNLPDGTRIRVRTKDQ